MVQRQSYAKNVIFSKNRMEEIFAFVLEFMLAKYQSFNVHKF